MPFFAIAAAVNRVAARRKPFLPEWDEILHEHCKFVDDIVEQDRFRDHIKILLHSTSFIGAQGQEINDEVRVTIAACAARMARNLPFDIYEGLREIVVYPSTFMHASRDPLDKEGGGFGLYTEGSATPTLGLASSDGRVILSWDAVRRGIATPNDGHDTALHEFAHHLDFEDGAADGAPLLHSSRDYHGWTMAFVKSYDKIQKKTWRHTLRSYGATNPAEFFAVATETFFEKPKKLRRKEPELYEELSNYYKLDPASDKEPT